MKVKKTWLGVMVVFLFLSGSFVWAQQPQNANPQVQSFKAKILEIQGDVMVKRPADADLVDAEVGMELPEGTEIHTGYGSSVKVRLFSKETKEVVSKIEVEIKSQTKLEITHLLETPSQNAVRTDMNLERGHINLDVKKGHLETDTRVSTPNSTTSIRGTELTIHSFPDCRGMEGANFSSTRVANGTVTVQNNDTGAAISVTTNNATNVFGNLPTNFSIGNLVQSGAPPFIGATPMELNQAPMQTALTGPATQGFLVGGLAPGSTTNPVMILIITQQLGMLPLPPPPPIK